MRRDGWKPYLIAFAIVVAAGCSRSASLEGITDPAERGTILYRQSCQTCHAPDGTGVSGLGNSMVDNEFIQSHTDEELIAFIKVGRPASDPDNVTGVDMLPYGGDPSLSDQDLQDIVAYLRTLQ